ncbi:kinase-like protein [Xylariaceae sp. FL0255]|nr:kinase-like protein [Xylariaceae sp. FL0255]
MAYADISEALELSTKIQKNFKNRFWAWEKLLGSGTNGFTILMSLHDEFKSSHCRVAFKFASGFGQQQELRSEAAMLKELNGAKHIVSILGYCVHAGTAGDKEDTGILSNVPPSTAFGSFQINHAPVLALEYLELGDLYSLVVIRAVVGMAYPIAAEIGTPPILEEIGDDDDPRAIVHGDIHDQNVMFSTSDGIPEHVLVPILKVIDFGLARDLDQLGFGLEEEEKNIGWQRNLQDMANQIMAMIPVGQAFPLDGVVDYRGLPTRAEEILVREGGTDIRHPWLCPELRDLLARCLYEDQEQRPGLREVLEIARKAVLTKTAFSFPEPGFETDDAIRSFAQEFFFDATAST